MPISLTAPMMPPPALPRTWPLILRTSMGLEATTCAKPEKQPAQKRTCEGGAMTHGHHELGSDCREAVYNSLGEPGT